MGQWVFEELRGAAVRRGPQEALLFKTEQTAEGEYAGNDALVREILQNAVDARCGNGPVRVRFAIHEAGDAPPVERLAHYFERLREPLSGRMEFGVAGAPEMPCRFLVCEDFGTRGLEGSSQLFNDPPPDDTTVQDFYWFWRNIGRSGKTGEDLGRWGLGKTVFRAASRSGCMFGLTIRRSDGNRLLMGQAVLQIHRHDGKQFQPEGYWCGIQDPTNDLPLPVAAGEELNHFSKEWRLTRSTEPGTSIVSPYIPDELKGARLVQAVAVHFFTRILRGELEVEVVGKDIGNKLLSQSTIEAVCKDIAWDGPKRTKRHAPPPIAFAKRCLKAPPTVATEVLGKTKLPQLGEDSLAPESLALLRSSFAASDPTAIRVRLNLPRRQGSDKEGCLDLHLQRLADGEKCDTYFVREGMTITKLNSRAGTRGIQALVVVDPGPLAELLGDTEGPAHEDWDTSEERPDRVWKTWKGRVGFVRKIVDHVVELLTPATTEPDFDLLSDFFSIEKAEGPQRQRKPGEEQNGKPKFNPPPYEPKWFQIAERAGGFTVSRMPSVPMPENPALSVAVAYDLPRGDPLRNWNSLDFEIGENAGQLKPKGKGLKAKRLAGNRLLLNQFEESFSISVDGFDRHRDLLVRVDELANNEDAS